VPRRTDARPAGIARGRQAVDAGAEKLTSSRTLGYGTDLMRTRAAIVLLSAALIGVGCKPESKEATPPAASAKPTAAATADTVETSEVIATYSGEKLTSAEVLTEIERLPGPSRAYLTAPDRKRQFVENMILNDLLFAEGQKAGYDTDPEIERQVTDMRKRLVVQRLMREYQKPPEISDADAQKYYDENPNLYSTTQIKASHILVKDEATAKTIHDQLVADPSKFADIAKEQSTDKTSGAKGGDLGKFGQGRMVPEFEKVAFALKPGQLSEVVKTQYGWHIIIVTERDDGERKPFDQVKEQIKATIRNKALQDNMQSKFDALKKSANLTIDDKALDKITPPPAPAAPAGNPHAGMH
jgi:peptidyl-prolyl cis-trans isomerase C